ncbi:unnamed protein product [Protopolystoma xenopodis]|uniref:Uncharacterized protein n=1 Tax=Protopolystoma xenopodis TaxID=117903 RepID=A0A3S5CSK2_9PLAT|nr:unnamed protein product [Protopolystoma xenopodis]
MRSHDIDYLTPAELDAILHQINTNSLIQLLPSDEARFTSVVSTSSGPGKPASLPSDQVWSSLPTPRGVQARFVGLNEEKSRCGDVCGKGGQRFFSTVTAAPDDPSRPTLKRQSNTASQFTQTECPILQAGTRGLGAREHDARLPTGSSGDSGNESSSLSSKLVMPSSGSEAFGEAGVGVRDTYPPAINNPAELFPRRIQSGLTTANLPLFTISAQLAQETGKMGRFEKTQTNDSRRRHLLHADQAVNAFFGNKDETNLCMQHRPVVVGLRPDEALSRKEKENGTDMSIKGSSSAGVQEEPRWPVDEAKSNEEIKETVDRPAYCKPDTTVRTSVSNDTVEPKIAFVCLESVSNERDCYHKYKGQYPVSSGLVAVDHSFEMLA